MNTKENFSNIASSKIDVATLKKVISELRVRDSFRQKLMNYFESKGIFKYKNCNSLVLGAAFGEFSNKNIDHNSLFDMRDFDTTILELSNLKSLPLV